MVYVRALVVAAALAMVAAACSDSASDESAVEAGSVPSSTGVGESTTTGLTPSLTAPGSSDSLPDAAAPTSTGGPSATTTTVPAGGALPGSVVVGQRRPFFAHLLDGVRVSTSDGSILGQVEGHQRAPSATPEGFVLVEVPLLDLPEYDEDLLLEYGNGAQLTFEDAKSRAAASAVQLLRAPDGSTITFHHGALASSWFVHGGSWWEDVLPDGRIVGMWADDGWSGVFVEADTETDLGARLGEERAYIAVAAQRTGNLVVVEADAFTGDNPQLHVIDPDDGAPVATFPVAEGVSRVLSIDYDPSRTWLAVLYDGGVVEILGNGTRTLFQLPAGDYYDIAW